MEELTAYPAGTLCIYNTYNMYFENTNNIDGIATLINRTAGRVNTSNYITGAEYSAVKQTHRAFTDGSYLTVRVKLPNENIISDTYTDFALSDLGADLNNIALGVFAGDTNVNLINLLGQSAIVHITCTMCNVSVTSSRLLESEKTNASISDVAIISRNRVTGVSKGVIELNMTVDKSGCTVHGQDAANVTTTLHVFKKPTTSTTATTLTLTNLDEDCEYFIGNVKGQRTTDEDGKPVVIFTGLTPNTEYEVTVRASYETGEGNYKTTKYIFAYVKDVTKQAYRGYVNTYLHTVANPTGTLTDIEDILGQDAKLYFKLNNGLEYIRATHTGNTGEYSAVLSNGTYYTYYKENANSQYITDNQQLVINNRNNSRSKYFYQVEYDTGLANQPKEYDPVNYVRGSLVTLAAAPQKEGFVFDGWEDQNGNKYNAGATLTSNIEKPYKLTAKWIKTKDIYVNVNINHVAKSNGDIDGSDTKDLVRFALQHRKGTSGDFMNAGEPYVTLNSEVSNSEYIYNYDSEKETTTYTAIVPNFDKMPTDYEYTISVNKSGYALTEKGIEKEEDESKIVFTVNLIYTPSNFDFVYSVRLDEEASKLPDSVKPISVNVKVTSYYNTPSDGLYDTGNVTAENKNKAYDWFPVTGHDEIEVSVDVNPDGTSKLLSYPVAKEYLVHNDVTGETTHEPYLYRIEIISYNVIDEEGKTVIIPATNNNHSIYASEDETYTATLKVTNTDKKDSEYGLLGAWYNPTTQMQQGNVEAVISIETHDVIFDPNGGKLNGSESRTIVENQALIPNLNNYVPTRDGGYLFEGWYYENTQIEAKTDDYLTDTVVLVAKWKAPLTIKGQVAVAGSYIHNGEWRTISEDDRAQKVIVKLQEKDVGTIDNKEIEITYNNIGENAKDIGFGNFEFSPIEDKGKVYRVVIETLNFTSSYQVEPSSLDANSIKDYANYSENLLEVNFGTDDASTANIDESKIGVVNAYLDFTPKEFSLKYRIITTDIGEGFKPEEVETLILQGEVGDDFTRPHSWPVIDQMTMGYGEDEYYVGKVTELTSDVTDDEYESVWVSCPNGNLHSYAILIDGYSLNGYNHDSLNEAPFTVAYNGTARYDENSIMNQTQMLIAKLIPKEYRVNFIPNTGTDEFTGLEDYTNKINNQDVYYKTHTWSYETDISDAIPERDGYKFLGWILDEDNDGIIDNDETTYITKVSADTKKDINVIASWEKVQDSVTLKLSINNVSEEGGADDSIYSELINVILLSHNPQGKIYEPTAHTTTIANWHKDGETFDTYVKEKIFKDLPSQYDYSLNVSLEHYIITDLDNDGDNGISVTPQDDPDSDGTEYIVEVELQYDPSRFDIHFDVEMKDKDTDKSLWPAYADVKITSWYPWPENYKHADTTIPNPTEGTVDWNIISEHLDYIPSTEIVEDVEVPVAIGETGTYPVRKGTAEKPYYYRIQVMKLVMEDGTIFELEEQDNGNVVYKDKNGIYTATIETTGGGIPDTGTNLYGVYCGQDGAQVGKIKALISVSAPDITILPNGGEFNSSITTNNGVAKIEDVLKIPNLDKYKPSKNGYIFKEWIYDENNNGVIDSNETKLDHNMKLVNDIQIIANYDPIVYNIHYYLNGGTISGTYPTTYTVESETIVHPIPTKEEAVFDGWYIEPDFSGEKQFEIAKGSTGNKYFFAKWEVDKVGDKDPETGEDISDEIPDKYQIPVRFKVVNGTWDGTKNADIIEYVTLFDDAGNWLENGKGKLKADQIPTNMIPDPGYKEEGASWKPTAPEVTTEITRETENVFTYEFVIDNRDVKYPDADKDEDNDNKPDEETVEVQVTKYILVNPNGGIWKGSTDIQKEQITKSDEAYSLEDPTYEGYVFMGWQRTDGSDDIVYIFTAQWEKDVVGGNDPETHDDIGDEIPDKYQAPVTFKVVNGTWNDSTNTDIIEYVTLFDENGKWAEDGIGNLEDTQIPTNMIPNPGYKENGAVWSPETPTINKEISKQTNNIFTYEFVIDNRDVEYPDADKDEDEDNKPDDEVVEVQVTKYILVDPNGGVWNGNSEKQKIQIEATQSSYNLKEDPTYNGYVFMGWKRTYGTDDIVYVFTAQWEKDSVGDKDPETHDDIGDEIPDKYQVPVTFKIENGTWDGTQDEDIVEYVTLTKENGKWDEKGTGRLAEEQIPDTLKAKPVEGYKNIGNWNENPSSETIIKSAKTYIYSFGKLLVPVIYHDVETEDEYEQVNVVYDEYIKIDPNGGIWKGSSKVQKIQIKSLYSIEKPSYPGYKFMGWKRTLGDEENVKYVFTAQWEREIVNTPIIHNTVQNIIVKPVPYTGDNKLMYLFAGTTTASTLLLITTIAYAVMYLKKINKDEE